jgi:spore germination protein YaaH
MRILMFDRLPVPLLPMRRAEFTPIGGWRTPTLHLRLGFAFAVAIAVSSGLSVTSAGRAYGSDSSAADVPSIQYQEALSHAGAQYSFTPGGVVTVPFRPRRGDTAMVGGAAPVALPAARGSAGATPAITGPALVTPAAAGNYLRREVFGFLPYWELGSTLDYSTLSTVAYFGIALNTDGTLAKSGNGWNGWVSTTLTSMINAAHGHNTRVALTVESFAWDSNGAANQTAILANPAVSLTAAQQIAAEVGNRGVDGVNLDFEPIAPGQAANYVTFVRMLRVELDKVHAGYELTFCGTGHPNTYNLANLTAPGAADAAFIMGYDFRGGSPATTGSIDPLTSPYIFDLSDAVTQYLSQAPASAVILGLPWYGHAWSTGGLNTGNVHPADPSVYGQPAAVYYSTAAPLAAMNDSTHLGKMYDTVEQTAWTAYYGSYGGLATWRELYFDDARALAAKCAAVDGWNLRGVGIWALGYDTNNGNGDLTAAIAASFEVQGSTYHALTPTRILDTRDGTGGLSGKFVSPIARTFQVTGAGGVPAGAVAVTGNLTVTQQSAAGYLFMGPNPTNNPGSSTLNFPVGEDRANAVTLALGAGGTLSATYVAAVTAKAQTAHVVFDVTGYFTPDPNGSTYHALAPTRILDSRDGTGGLSGTFSAYVARTFQVTGSGGVPVGAVAITGNLTVTQQSAAGYLFIGPIATNNPGSSTLNFPVGDNRANAVTVALGTGGALGTLSITYVAGPANATTHVVFDVTGYFTTDAG